MPSPELGIPFKIKNSRSKNIFKYVLLESKWIGSSYKAYDCIHPLRPSVVLYILLNSDVSRIISCVILSEGQVQLTLKLDICILCQGESLGQQNAGLAVGLSIFFSWVIKGRSVWESKLAMLMFLGVFFKKFFCLSISLPFLNPS